MKKLINLTLIFAVAAIFASCKITDTPSISVEKDNYIVTAGGGPLVIPVTSTGIDDVEVDYREEYYEWTVDSETGDRTPALGWITIERVINNYEPKTRELPSFGEGVSLMIAPNLSGVEREAYIRIKSFTKSAVVSITQVPLLSTSEE